MRRRNFLSSSIGLSAGLLVPNLTGCSSDSGEPNQKQVEPQAYPIQKGPFVQFVGPGRARLRFETSVDEPIELVVVRGGEGQTYMPTRAAQQLDYSRPGISVDDIPDEPGLHVLHEVLLEGLTPGEEVEYNIPKSDPPVAGRFRAQVASGTAFRLGWVADTMFPLAKNGVELLASHKPDVIVHGGDINYDPNPFDTWNGTMAGFAPLLRLAPMHFIVGNHEFESQDEIKLQYDRLFTGQGDAGGTARYFAFTYGSMRFLCLDTESESLTNLDLPQFEWLDKELEAASKAPEITEIVVGFHRPTYTLSKHGVGDTTVREQLHERFLAHGVRLVFAGHAHSYERFIVDGIQYVIDGGGGALLYDPDEDLERIESERPGEAALRVIASKSYGISILDMAADGALHLRRFNAKTGEQQDELHLPARS